MAAVPRNPNPLQATIQKPDRKEYGILQTLLVRLNVLRRLQGHTDMVWGVALSGDGQLAASGGADGTVRLWDVRDGTCLHTLRGERSYDRLDITGLTGVTAAQRAALLALGALDGARADDACPRVSPLGQPSSS